MNTGENFNRLTPAQTETLAIVAEECCEVGQAVTKILRHGMDSYHPISRNLNRPNLAREIGDLLGAFKLLERQWPGIMEEAEVFLKQKPFNPNYFHHVGSL